MSTASDQYFLSYVKKNYREGQIDPPSRNKVKQNYSINKIPFVGSTISYSTTVAREDTFKIRI